MYTYFMLLHLLGLLSALYLWLTIADDCLLSYSIMHCVWGLHYDSCILRVKWVSKVQSVLASCPFGFGDLHMARPRSSRTPTHASCHDLHLHDTPCEASLCATEFVASTTRSRLRRAPLRTHPCISTTERC